MKITRRQLGVALAPAAAAAARAQQPSAPTEDLPGLARERMKNNANALNAVKLPIATEPAFQFKV